MCAAVPTQDHGPPTKLFACNELKRMEWVSWLELLSQQQENFIHRYTKQCFDSIYPSYGSALAHKYLSFIRRILCVNLKFASRRKTSEKNKIKIKRNKTFEWVFEEVRETRAKIKTASFFLIFFFSLVFPNIFYSSFQMIINLST